MGDEPSSTAITGADLVERLRRHDRQLEDEGVIIDDHSNPTHDRSLAADEIERLTALVVQFADGEPCWLDHHGYCQAHLLHSPPCPFGVANEMASDTLHGDPDA